MIIVHYFKTGEEEQLNLVGIVNDEFDLYWDSEVITEALANDDDFQPDEDALYTVYMQRANIASDPIPEPSFSVMYHTKMEPISEPPYWKEPTLQF